MADTVTLDDHIMSYNFCLTVRSQSLPPHFFSPSSTTKQVLIHHFLLLFFMARGRPTKHQTPQDRQAARAESNRKYYEKTQYVTPSSFSPQPLNQIQWQKEIHRPFKWPECPNLHQNVRSLDCSSPLCFFLLPSNLIKLFGDGPTQLNLQNKCGQ